MAHYFVIEGVSDTFSLIPFCSDECHRQYCKETKRVYERNGPHDPADGDEYCELCLAVLEEA